MLDSDPFTVDGQTESRWSPLQSLPIEVTKLIVLYLPIDKHLMSVALSARTFSCILLNDWSFSKRLLNTRTTKNFYDNIRTLRHRLPLSFVSALFHNAFEVRTLDWNHKKHILDFSTSMGASSLETMAAYLCESLPKNALPDLLEWICKWRTDWPMQTLLTVVKRYPNIPTPYGFMNKALFNSWKEIVKIMVDGGWDVSAHNYEAIVYAINQDDCEMMKILLQDHRVDLSVHDYVFCQRAKSLAMAEILFSDKRIPNGEFLKSIARGDAEAVTNYLAVSEVKLSNIKTLCQSVAVQFHQNTILQLLRDIEQLKPGSADQIKLLERAALSKKWTAFQTIVDNDQFDPCANDWKILSILSNAWVYMPSYHEPLIAFTSKERVRQLMGQHQKWEFLLENAIGHRNHPLLEFVLKQAGSDVNVNSPQVIKTAMKVGTATEDSCRIFNRLARHKSFQTVVDADASILLKVMIRHREYLSSFLLSKKQKFFSVAFLQKTFDEGCRLHYTGSAFLACHPKIQVSHEQAKTVEFLLYGDPKHCDLDDCKQCRFNVACRLVPDHMI
ncbi:hypothetical protein BJ741DRAFT_638434 [Chytriomyces cf. hyalinus JEL632]|nr:hypothetical protein BJ741DRAFT_638434 [Chytriomyces cf. hyalinus JEL632]